MLLLPLDEIRELTGGVTDDCLLLWGGSGPAEEDRGAPVLVPALDARLPPADETDEAAVDEAFSVQSGMPFPLASASGTPHPHAPSSIFSGSSGHSSQTSV